MSAVPLGLLAQTGHALAPRHALRVRGVNHDRGRVTFSPLFLPDDACVSEKGN